MIDKLSKLVPEKTYNIFNRANGSERLFLSADNYQFFLRKYEQYISPISNTYCYCLMPNHFHFLVKIKEEDVLKEYFKAKKNLQGFENLEGLLSQQFSNFFNAYAKAFNKQQKRNGSLFSRPYKRKIINDEKYSKKLIHYIHHNPIEAGLANSLDSWKYSSYKTLISINKTLLLREEILDYFDVIVCSDQVGFNKPDTAIFKIALEKANVTAPHTMMIGDHPEIDVLGANQVGMRGVLFDPLFHYQPHPAIERITSLNQLTRLVVGL